MSKQTNIAPIAIVGMACRFPGKCNDTQSFWRLLENERSAITALPKQRFKWPSADTPKRYPGINQGGFIDDIQGFDALSFNISPKEARVMDPQQRLLLELAWQCFESNGRRVKSFQASCTGVYIGATNTDYFDAKLTQYALSPDAYDNTGTSLFSLANRISQQFNLVGPSQVIDTASSSSLVAIAEAVAHLRAGRCQLALAGGVNLICSPFRSIAYYEAGMLSSDGLCRSFDDAANGYVRGEGAGLVLLKPLPAAIEEQDPILAIIRHADHQHGGQSNAMTVPQVDYQADFIRQVYHDADISLSSIDYIEAHGSGTPAGDPVELNALKKIFQKYLQDRSLLIGSVKPNIGHLEAAAGCAGLVKTILSLQNQKIPATLNHSILTKSVDLDGGGLLVNTTTRFWPENKDRMGQLPRRAGVSAFGLGGVNAHLIVEEAPELPDEIDSSQEAEVVVLSGASLLELQQLSQSLYELLDEKSHTFSLRALAYTLQTGRDHYRHRLAIIAHSHSDLIVKLKKLLSTKISETDSYRYSNDDLLLNSPMLSTGSAVKQIVEHWLAGYDVDWERFFVDSKPRRVFLPTRLFKHKYYWHDKNSSLRDEKEKIDTIDIVKRAIAKVLEIELAAISDDLTLNELYLDSIAIRAVCIELSEWSTSVVTPDLFYRATTVAELSALVEIDHTVDVTQIGKRQKHSDHNSEKTIAIIGMAAELPAAKTLEEFWNNLVNNKDCISEMPPYDPARQSFIQAAKELYPDMPWLTQGGWISDIDCFDAKYFNMSPLEAEYTDPQLRRLLQNVYQTLNQAGIKSEALRGTRTGIFVGVMNNDYQELLIDGKQPIHPFMPIGNSTTMLANRLSYQLGCHGPSLTINTACSSSLVAVHQACAAIESGDCEQAIVCGVNIICNASLSAAFNKSGMLSKNGRCKTFSAYADGYVRGEGVASVLIKPLDQAQRDNNTIHAMILGSAINHGGRTNNLTAPSASAQGSLILAALEKAGVMPSDISYIETHGTGTSLGDPIEIKGIQKAFQPVDDSVLRPYCALGSLKTQIGHLESAAGIAGLIKVVLCMQNQLLPANLYAETTNKLIQLKKTPLYFLKNNTPWLPKDTQDNPLARIAGVSSFGFGGVNSHVILQEYTDENKIKNRLPLCFREKRFWFKPMFTFSLKAAKHEFQNIETNKSQADEVLWITTKPKHNVKSSVIVVDSTKPEEVAFEQLITDLIGTLQNKIFKLTKPYILQVQLESSLKGAYFQGVEAVLKTTHLEKPNFHYHCFSFDEQNNVYQKRLTRWQKIEAVDTPCWKTGGIYLFTGGFGKLSSVFVREILKECEEVTIILFVRDEQDIRGKSLQQLTTMEKNIKVVAVNLEDKESVCHAVDIIRKKYGKITGVIHTAGACADSYLFKKEKNEIGQVLRPKVYGIRHLDIATKDDLLDFFIAFSSFVACDGNIGQADYAAANAYLDQFILNRAELVLLKKRSGLSLSINWPLWAEGGMGQDAFIREKFFQKLGMIPLPNHEGISALYQAINSETIQVKVNYCADKQVPQPLSQDVLEPCQQSSDSKIMTLSENIVSLIAQSTKTEPSVISTSEALSKYGVDSIVIMLLNAELEKHIKGISKTLFFECYTIDEVVNYLEKHHADECSAWLGQPLKQKSSIAIDASQKSKENNFKEPIAIIGLAGQYSSADSPNALWDLLVQGREAISEIPASRWSWKEETEVSVDLAIEKNKSYNKWGGFIDNPYLFEPLFFNISPKEAINMDPQERLFLTCCWYLLQDASTTPEILNQYKTGVFVGVTKTGYELTAFGKNETKHPFHPRTSFSSIANRVSYHFNLKGPSLAIDTMCSASLTAIHEACLNIRSGCCDVAIAGGVNLYLHPDNFAYLSRMRMLSIDGKNRSFGKGSSGFIPGEGVGAVLLKPLHLAIRDKDNIYGTISGSAVNHGGKTQNYTVPNPKAQRDLIINAVGSLTVDDSKITYLEAHGTGTVLGDPIEIEGIKQAFKQLYSEQHHCAIGSIKSNIGHCEAAAGIAGLTKILLQLKYKQLVPSLYSSELNENINQLGPGFTIQQAVSSWAGKRTAAVSSFGAGGSNAHLVIDEYALKQENPEHKERKHWLIVWSSHFAGGLKIYAAKLLDYFTKADKQSIDLPRISYSLATGRVAYQYKIAVVARDVEELLELLKQIKSVESAGVINRIFLKDKVIASREYQLAQMWINGDDIEWLDYFKTDYLKISLPPFPLNQKEYKVTSRAISVMNNKELKPTYKSNKRNKVVLSKKQNNPSFPNVHSNTNKNVEKIQQTLKKQLADLLFIEINEIDVQSVFTDIGLDSIVGMEWAKKISATWSITTTAAKLYDYPTIEKLSKWIDCELGKPIQQNVILPRAEQNIESIEQPTYPTTKNSEHSFIPVLKKQLTEILNIQSDEIEVDTVFVDLGLDSIVAAEWAKRISIQLAISFSAAKLYDYPTLKELDRYLLTISVDKENMPDFRDSKKNELSGQKQVGFQKKNFITPKPEQVVKNNQSDKVAIIGLAGQYPDAKNINEFWKNLVAGNSSISDALSNRWDKNIFYRGDSGQKKPHWIGQLHDIDKFDAGFFSISPNEAKTMDPQQRVMLQQAWLAFESAGYSKDKLDGLNCGTYIGVMQNEYWQTLYQNHQDLKQAHCATGNSNAIMAARIAYYLNLTGPALSIDTACSSSLVAVHTACQALKTGEIDMALAGGVTLYLSPECYDRMYDAGMLSESGRCYTFDKRADGFVPAEGVAAVVLKRLEEAKRDNDTIYGVILASGLNQDGKTNGITAPSSKAQTDLQKRIYKRDKINPRTISYVEAHGTGTQLGDPIEIEALSGSFAAFTTDKQFCRIGSVKSNVGHTSAAAGIVSLHKILLAMHYKQLPASINFEEENPHLKFKSTPFIVNDSLTKWELSHHVSRRAAINSFGYSGTNAHMVLEEVINDRAQLDNINEDSYYPLILSASNEQSLTKDLAALKEFVESNEIRSTKQFSYTSILRFRQTEPKQLIILFNSQKGLLETLNQVLSSTVDKALSYVYRRNMDYVNPTIRSIFEESVLQEQIVRWLNNREATLLCKLWSEGVSVNWTMFYADEKISPLPFYPVKSFNTERYWVNEAALPALKRSFYHFKWVSQVLSDSSMYDFKDCAILCVNIDSRNVNALKAETSCLIINQKIELNSVDSLIFIVNNIREIKRKKIVILVPEYSTPEYSALQAFAKSYNQETKSVFIQTLSVSSSDQENIDDWKSLVLIETQNNHADHCVDYQQAKRHVLELEPTKTLALSNYSRAIKTNGIYLVTGGLGGIGRHIAHYLTKTFNARVILCGRSRPDASGEQLLASHNFIYFNQTDITDDKAVKALFARIDKDFGTLDGIFHCAGVLRDGLFFNKTNDDFRQVLSPKISGLYLLDKYSQHYSLDCFVLFSSIASVLGNIGQTDYALANAYMDSYAKQRNILVQSGGARSGHTVSINWPLWLEGGMQVNEEKLQWFERNTGILPLSTQDALEALLIAIAQKDYGQLSLVNMNTKQEQRTADIEQTDKRSDETPTLFSKRNIDDRGNMLEQVTAIYAEVLGLAAPELDPDAHIEEFGVDSIMMMKILNKLEKKLGKPVSPAAINEYPSISKLVTHLNKTGFILPNPQININKVFNKKKEKRVAIIGYACRFPKSDNSEQFWNHLQSGADLVTRIPDNRWPNELITYYENNQLNLRDEFGGFINNIDEFDAELFKLSDNEALTLDPQQRLMLELAYELYSKGNTKNRNIMPKNTGIYIGAKENTYIRDNYQHIPTSALKYSVVNNIGNMIAARIANYYDFTGQVTTIDTACSSSLVAVHDAARSILFGQHEVALAGGIYLLLDPFAHVGFKHANVLSPEGKSRVFDIEANGIVLSEGAGLVLLKDYELALEDGNHIIATICASEVNNDGKTIGLTVPNQQGQEAVINSTLARGNINPADISYYEAHGTGTLLGDPIEIKAMTNSYRRFTQERQYCALGSVKSNMGHTMLAAGVTSLIKVLLCMEHKTLVPTIHCDKPHARFGFEDSPFFICKDRHSWKKRNGARLAAISSFGFGGTNCHMVLAAE